jgi:hypothetical protein
MPWSAIGALILLAGAAPARAGGYWDAGPGLPPSPAYRDCDRACAPPAPPPCGCERRYADEYQGPPPPEEFAGGDVGFEGGVGPAFFDTGGGGGAVFVENGGGGFGGIDIALFERQHLQAMARARSQASAHASAYASAQSQTYVSTQVHVQQQQHMMHMRSYSPAPSYHMSGGRGRW